MFCIQLNKRLDHWVLKPYRLINMNLHPYLGLETPFKDQEFQLVTLSPPTSNSRLGAHMWSEQSRATICQHCATAPV